MLCPGGKRKGTLHGKFLGRDNRHQSGKVKRSRDVMKVKKRKDDVKKRKDDKGKHG